MIEKENLYKYACISFILAGICLMTPMGFVFRGHEYLSEHPEVSFFTAILIPTGIVFMFLFYIFLCMGIKDSLNQMKARTNPEIRE